jgi:zinc protease
MGTQDVIKLEVVVFSGRPYERKKMVSRVTGSILKEGAGNLNAVAIAESFDYYGSSLSHPVQMDTSHLVVHSITEHFTSILSLVAMMLKEPHFPRNEMESYLERGKQKLLIELTKGDVVAYRKITELIFGSDHPYGYNSEASDFDEIKREDLLEHFERLYYPDNTVIFLSGKFGEREVEALDNTLGKWVSSKKGSPEILKKLGVENGSKVIERIGMPEMQQTAIRIGRKLFKRDHPDFAGMFVLNTILGGYFSSRLMNNLREEKGFTYNIFSAIDTMKYDGYFCIGAEVNNENSLIALDEIMKEIQILRNHEVGREELKMVKNYLLGNYLNLLDGPFNVSDALKGLVVEDVSFDHYDQLMEKIKNLNAGEIRELACKYLNPADLTEVIVGPTY